MLKSFGQIRNMIIKTKKRKGKKMKNRKLFSILTLVLSLAVLTAGLCSVASATEEDTDLSVSIIKKNVA